MKVPRKYISRQAEISTAYIEAVNKHMDEFMSGKVEEILHIKDIAGILCLHPVHLSNTVKIYTGHHPCYFFEKRIIAEAKKLLNDPSISIAAVAMKLSYDSSNFTKFFKAYEGMTPSEYRRTSFPR